MQNSLSVCTGPWAPSLATDNIQGKNIRGIRDLSFYFRSESGVKQTLRELATEINFAMYLCYIM